jgi:hypothetical protein
MSINKVWIAVLPTPTHSKRLLGAFSMTNNLQPIPAYVYKITCLPTGEYYFGFRAAHILLGRRPIQDLWVKYFTSSKIIKQLLQKYTPDNFDAVIIAEYLDPDEAYWAEQDIISAHLGEYNCLNKWYRRQGDNAKVFHNLGQKYTRSDKAMANYKAAGLKKRGRKMPPKSDEYRKNASIRQTGKRHKPETIEHLRQIKTGLPKSPESIEKHAAKLRGRPQSSDHVNNRIESMKRTLNDPTRLWLTCSACGYQTQNKTTHTRYHGINCTPKLPKRKYTKRKSHIV